MCNTEISNNNEINTIQMFLNDTEKIKLFTQSITVNPEFPSPKCWLYKLVVKCILFRYNERTTFLVYPIIYKIMIR
jgi:hypothetical protein